MRSKDYYKVLGVARDADDAEIKRAFRKLARKYHPDVATGVEAEARFKEVNEAYEVLKNPEKRAEYDNPQTEKAFKPRPEWDGGFGFAHPGAGTGERFSDIFDQFYQSGPRGHAGMAAADQHARIDIPLTDAFTGATRTLVLQSPRIDPDGGVSFEERNIAVHIPKGVLSGQNIRLRGKGLRLPDGAGDLFLEVAFEPHPVYRPEGRDLHLELPVTAWEAALGQKVVLPTPGGKVDLKIPANARSGQKLRLKGKGLPAHPPGDIYATLKIVNPQVKTDAQRAIFEQLAREMPFNPRAAMGG